MKFPTNEDLLFIAANIIAVLIAFGPAIAIALRG